MVAGPPGYGQCPLIFDLQRVIIEDPELDSAGDESHRAGKAMISI
jgi:hypothetical protein